MWESVKARTKVCAARLRSSSTSKVCSAKTCSYCFTFFGGSVMFKLLVNLRQNPLIISDNNTIPKIGGSLVLRRHKGDNIDCFPLGIQWICVQLDFKVYQSDSYVSYHEFQEKNCYFSLPDVGLNFVRSFSQWRQLWCLSSN